LVNYFFKEEDQACAASPSEASKRVNG